MISLNKDIEYDKGLGKVLDEAHKKFEARKQLVREYKLLKADLKALDFKYNIVRDLFVILLTPIQDQLDMFRALANIYEELKHESGL